MRQNPTTYCWVFLYWCVCLLPQHSLFFYYLIWFCPVIWHVLPIKSGFQLLTMGTSRPAGWMTLLILYNWEYEIFHILLPLGGNQQLIWKVKEISRNKILFDSYSKAMKESYTTGWRNILWSRNMTTRWNAAMLHGVSIWVCLHCQKKFSYRMTLGSKQTKGDCLAVQMHDVIWNPSHLKTAPIVLQYIADISFCICLKCKLNLLSFHK